MLKHYVPFCKEGNGSTLFLKNIYPHISFLLKNRILPNEITFYFFVFFARTSVVHYNWVCNNVRPNVRIFYPVKVLILTLITYNILHVHVRGRVRLHTRVGTHTPELYATLDVICKDFMCNRRKTTQYFLTSLHYQM